MEERRLGSSTRVGNSHDSQVYSIIPPPSPSQSIHKVGFIHFEGDNADHPQNHVLSFLVPTSGSDVTTASAASVVVLDGQSGLGNRSFRGNNEQVCCWPYFTLRSLSSLITKSKNKNENCRLVWMITTVASWWSRKRIPVEMLKTWMVVRGRYFTICHIT